MVACFYNVMHFLGSSVADSGRPPASGFASVIISGLRPVISEAYMYPVLPRPVCISSAISMVSFSAQSLLVPAQTPLSSVQDRLHPSTVSTITAANSRLRIFESESGSLKGATVNTGTSGSYGSWYVAFGVHESAPKPFHEMRFQSRNLWCPGPLTRCA